MNLETVIQSKVRQKKRKNYHILTHVSWIWTNGTDDLICRAEIGTDIQNECMDTKGKGRGDMGWTRRLGMTYTLLCIKWASLVAQLVKNPPGMRETWVQSLGWEDPLERGKATHTRILALRIPWTAWSMESQRVGHDWVTFTFTCKADN